jgi:hypothetical protein
MDQLQHWVCHAQVTAQGAPAARCGPRAVQRQRTVASCCPRSAAPVLHSSSSVGSQV